MSAAVPHPSDRAPDSAAGWRRKLADELRPRCLLQSVNAAVILYLLTAILTLSLAALVYSGPLASQLQHAVGGVLIGTALLVAMVTLFGSYGGSIAPAQDATSVIVALGAAAASAAVAGRSVEAQFATVSVLVLGSTLAMGLVYLLIRWFRLGKLVRFMPHPVMGGFLAGTGWLLVVGGIGVATDVPLGVGLLAPHALARWLPAFALGLAMLLAVRRWANPTLLAVLSALALVFFYAVMWALGKAPSELSAQGWLLGPFPDEMGWRFPLDPQTLAAVDWNALALAAPVAAPAILIGAIALLLNISALELVVKRDIALDRELLAHGVGNLLGGLAGGLMGYTALSDSTLNHSLARGRRLPGLMAAVFVAMTALLGTSLVSSIPRLVIAGLAIYIGLELLHEWVVVARRTLARSDYAVVLMIFAVIAIENFLWGVALGLVVTTLLFLVSYSRIDVVRYELSGDAVQSRVARDPRQRQWLQGEGARLLALQLQGYLFFGTASGLLERVRRRLPAAGGYVLLDFEHVSGLDSTALMSFVKLSQCAAERGVGLVLCGMDERIAVPFRREAELASLRRFADIDRAIEWCEERLLERASDAGAPAAGTLREQLLALVPDEVGIDALLQNTIEHTVHAGERLIRKGDEPDAFYLVESGLLSAQLARGDGREAVRLQTMCAGSVVGEVGFLLGSRRSADVVAERDSVLRVIDRATWRRIVEQQPDIVRTLDIMAIRLLGERLVRLTRVVDALQR